MASDSSEALYLRVSEHLKTLEGLMRQAELWQAGRPDASALASPLPFCIDTLSFEQWLQFLFVPRMHALIVERAPLPTEIALQPMAEEMFGARPECQALILHLGCLDLCLTEARR